MPYHAKAPLAIVLAKGAANYYFDLITITTA